MKWFFVLNSGADLWFSDMIRVAILSARENADFEPHCIYDGAETRLSKWMERNGVILHRTRVPFYDELFSDQVLARNKNSNYSPTNASGAYLKVLIPDFCDTSELFIYTDIDILFRKVRSTDLVNVTTTLAATPEIDGRGGLQGADGDFNSGVFVADSKFFRSRIPEMLSTLDANAYFFWGKPGFYDQGLFNLVFRGEWTPMDSTYNWRAYWEAFDEAKIIHFHGPKPLQIERILHGIANPFDLPHITKMVNDNKPALVAHFSLFKEYLSRPEFQF